MTAGRARFRRLRLAVLAVVTLLVWLPFLSLVAGLFLAGYTGCQVDEGSVHPCPVGGFDLGPMLYDMTVAGWLMIAALPFMLLTALAWAGLALAWVVRRLRRGTVRRPAP
jgi:hypothetical protein